MFWNDHTRLCDEIRLQCRRLSAVLAQVDPGTPVPGCPGWTAAHLTGHLHAAFTWATGMLNSGTVEFRPPHTFLPDIPDGALDTGAPWPAYIDALTHAHLKTPLGTRIVEEHSVAPLTESADAFVDALLASGPDRPVWACLGEPRARCWATWGALESGIHRMDAEVMLGVTPELDRDVAEELVAFTLELATRPASAAFFDPQLARLRHSGERMLLRAAGSTGGPGEWLIHLGPSGPVLLAPDAGRPDVIVDAPGELLLPLLKRRLPLSAPGIRVTGDRDVVRDWLDHVFS
ncbi:MULTISPECIES: maleylpyruvate isomerase N-terminal domain-containing protein [unclassified Streptomyces]|uniref:maleylpyruvate isomerase N-terminal domain-containing protein n=1 Tax=unclassified Streptomyces TaxID=2593676 RepID=UPI002E2E2B26|nr:maleylpyruvate isomerase N-terminal domain-containing protein [Streptomyces sp. NBC_01429]